MRHRVSAEIFSGAWRTSVAAKTKALAAEQRSEEPRSHQNYLGH